MWYRRGRRLSYLTSIFDKLEEVVREKGERADMTVFGSPGERSAWIIGNWLIILNEALPLTETARVVSVIDRGKQGLFIYLSPFVVGVGARQIFGIEDLDISSEKRLKEILMKIKAK